MLHLPAEQNAPPPTLTKCATSQLRKVRHLSAQQSAPPPTSATCVTSHLSKMRASQLSQMRHLPAEQNVCLPCPEPPQAALNRRRIFFTLDLCFSDGALPSLHTHIHTHIHTISSTFLVSLSAFSLIFFLHLLSAILCVSPLSLSFSLLFSPLFLVVCLAFSYTHTPRSFFCFIFFICRVLSALQDKPPDISSPLLSSFSCYFRLATSTCFERLDQI